MCKIFNVTDSEEKANQAVNFLKKLSAESDETDTDDETGTEDTESD